MIRPRQGSRRILLLFTEVFANGGIQRFNRTLLAALTELGMQCDVLSMHDTAATIASQSLPASVRVRGFNGNRLSFALATLRATCLGQHKWLMIGHINLLTLSIAAVAGRPFHSPRTLLIAHGIEVWYRIQRLRRLALGRVTRILCVSRYTRLRVLQQAPRLDPRRLSIFPNALGETWGHTIGNAPMTALPARFILSVTRLAKGDRYKGVVSVIEALPMVEDQSLQYMVVGQGKDRDFLQQVARRCGVGNRVHFLSAVSDAELVNLYARCVAFVLPSGKEGFGIVFLEAMYFNAPVIAAAEKGALDVIRDEETGLLVRFGDVSAIRLAIERLIGDPALCSRLRLAGRASVSNGGAFTFASFVDRAAAIFRLAAAATK